MSMKTQSEFSKFFGPVVATGAERICVRNLKDQFSCFKISKKIHSKETRREIKYFKLSLIHISLGCLLVLAHQTENKASANSFSLFQHTKTEI